jgi:hypothetical protein
MKKYSIFNVILALGLFLLGQSTFAQIRINQVGVGLSSWTRTYAGADERSLLIEGSQSEDFKPSAALPHLFVEVGVVGNLGIEGRVGVWNNTFTGSTALGSTIAVKETIVQRVTPLSLGLNYTLSVPENSNFFLHLGAGLNKYYLQNEVSREVTGTDGTVDPVIFAGNNNGFYAKMALEYRFTEKLGLSLQGRYNSGQYTQTFKESVDAELSSREISLQGFEVGLSLAYRLEGLFGKKEKSESTEEN